MELKIQTLLRQTPPDQIPSALKSLNIDYHEEEKDGHVFVHLDYGIGSSKTDPVVKECRGLVLRKSDWSVVRMAFHRFMNFDETGRDPFDFNKPLSYQEKCDGSLIILNYIPELKIWNAGTRGRIFPDSCIQNYDITFPQLFWSVLGDKNLDPELCYVFELCAPQNRVVVWHKTPKLFLLTVRKTDDWTELNSGIIDHIALGLNVSRPALFQFNSIEECLAYVKNIADLQEGLVLQQWNDQFNRYVRSKLKSEIYKSLHNIVSSRSLNNLVRLVLNGHRNVLNDFPEYFSAYDLISNEIDRVKNGINFLYQENEHFLDGTKEGRKLFALQVIKYPLGNGCFNLADKKVKDVEEWIRSYDTKSGLKKLIETLNLGQKVGAGWRTVEDADEDI